jgi:predicted nucleic acid-binding protein
LEKRVIYLDTGYLIQGLVKASKEAAELAEWYKSGDKIFAPAPAWFEFLCGPVTTRQVDIIRAFLSGGIAPFAEAQAAQASYLYDAIGRVRQFRVDSMIAGTAIAAGGILATSNTKHFQRFIPYGLTLISIP